MNQRYLPLLLALFAGIGSLWANGSWGDSIGVVGEGKFVTIPYAIISEDAVPESFTTQIRVGADFKGVDFAVKIEYPEYEKLGAPEAKALRLTSDTLVGEDVSVTSRLTVERKEGVIDVELFPYVERGGAYYKLKTCKLAVYRSSAARILTKTSAASTGRYASHSVLASGKWVKIRVGEEGVYQLSHSFLTSAGFSDPSKVKLYGYGGLMQDSVITYTGDNRNYDDLEEIPLYRDGSKILFYANGTTRWRFVKNKWRHINNPYSQYSYYLLTEGDSPATISDAPAATVTGGARTTVPGHALYEEDAYSWYSGGQQFYDSYDFAYGNVRSYSVKAPDIVTDETQYVTISFSASDATYSTTVGVESNSTSLGTMTLPVNNNSNLGEQGYRARIRERTYSTKSLAADNSIRFTVTSGHSARLDYIRLNYTRRLNLSSSYIELCDPAHSGAGLYSITSADASTRVWRLGTTGRALQNVAATLSGSTLSVALPESSDKYVVVNTAETFPSPTLVGKIENQDLHADSAADMVIIVPESGALTQQAERLAAAHAEHDGLRVRVVAADKIYNEFSSGTPDAMAYRRYLKMLYDRADTKADAPRYLLLFGDAAWDQRMITQEWKGYDPADFLLCYESWNSINEISSYVTDDFFAYLDDGEGKTMTQEKPDVAVGRFPVRTADEAKTMVDKTIAYMNNSSVGSWKNTICVMGDDDKTSNSLMSDAEAISKEIEANHPGYDVRRVYWDAYNVVKTSSGNTYPEITKILKGYMTSGALLMNYTGHGAPALISHEKVLTLADFKVKTDNPTVWITSSCEITPFDSQEETIGEVSLTEGGAVAFIGSTRSVYSTRNLYLNTYLMRSLLNEESDGRLTTLGEALMQAKCSLVSSSSMTDYTINKMKYVLTGDPALRLAAPVGRVVVDSINGHAASGSRVNLAAGSVARVVGHVVSYSGESMPGFSGVVSARVYDRLEQITCHDNAGNGSDPYVFYNRTRRLFDGTDSVRAGSFALNFPVSVDASYSDDPCQILLYAVSDDRSTECHGVNENFAINSSGELSRDTLGPAMFVFLNNPDFRDGDKTNTTPYFVAMLSDSDGINASGSGVGHDIELIIDGDPATSYVLNDYFRNDFGTFTSGSVGFSIPELEPGAHRLYFRAWDMLGNSSSTILNFTAVRGLSPNILDVSCTPNPASTSAVFNVSYDRPLTDVVFTVRVYDCYGQLVWRTRTTGSSPYGHYPISWNLTDASGARVGGGVYLYRVSVGEGTGAVSTKTKKLIILNNK